MSTTARQARLRHMSGTVMAGLACVGLMIASTIAGVAYPDESLDPIEIRMAAFEPFHLRVAFMFADDADSTNAARITSLVIESRYGEDISSWLDMAPEKPMTRTEALAFRKEALYEMYGVDTDSLGSSSR